MIEAMRQNNQELKQQLKSQGGAQGQANAQLIEKTQKLLEQVNFQETLIKRFKT